MPLIGGKNAKKKSSSSTTSKRHFTVVIGNKENGLYVSSSPSSAARKAVSKLCATDKKKKVQFHIREITQGSKKKTYGPYLGAIEKLDKPIELKGRVIKYKPVAKLSDKTGKKSAVKKGGLLVSNSNKLKSKGFPISYAGINEEMATITEDNIWDYIDIYEGEIYLLGEYYLGKTNNDMRPIGRKHVDTYELYGRDEDSKITGNHMHNFTKEDFAKEVVKRIQEKLKKKKTSQRKP